MNTLLEVTSRDGDIWSLEEDNGKHFVSHVFDANDIGHRTLIPFPPLALELMAKAIQRDTMINDERQKVIDFASGDAA